MLSETPVAFPSQHLHRAILADDLHLVKGALLFGARIDSVDEVGQRNPLSE
jgi:hypothetical protein